MSSLDDKRLIVGLGNPGSRYEKTRHNYGFMVVKALAERHGWTFKKPFRVNGELSTGRLGDTKVFLLMPMTYMNLSGPAIAKVMKLHGITPEQLMVVVDDVAIPFGTMRLRPKGSSGGHNGLRSTQQALQTQDYLRLRMGIGQDRPIEQPLESYVLSRFSREEEAQLPTLIDAAVEEIESWVREQIGVKQNERD